jgi:cell wall-associated NlpC family hydrolase
VNLRAALASPWPVLGVAALAILGGSAFALHSAVTPAYRYERVDDPARTLVRARDGSVAATLTDGARTAVFRGPTREFAEPDTTAATVTTHAWVRLAPTPWHADGERDATLGRWLTGALKDRRPDLLGIGTQYQKGAVDQMDEGGLRYAGDAAYGPLSDGERAENSDFNDYLGVDWTYPDGTVRHADPDHLGSLDCSGFVRMVFGYRSGYPLEWAPPTGQALPRRAVMMAAAGPGVPLIPDTGARVTDRHRLQPGDLVFFDADPGDGAAIDHVGIYLGPDSAGRPRFLSSRKTANGPTMGDLGGVSLLDGSGLYARAFRSAKRL